MSNPPPCSLLGLPQELRDGIYEYALNAESGPACSSTTWIDRTVSHKQAHCAGWTIHFDRQCPRATYLSLVRCNRQLWREITSLLEYPATPQGTARLTATFAPHTRSISTEWTCIPRSPSQLQDLFISVNVRNLFDPSLSTPHQHDVLLRPVFEILRRYVN